jgi:hypothetical protein
MKMTFCNVAVRNPVQPYRRFRGAYCLRDQRDDEGAQHDKYCHAAFKTLRYGGPSSMDITHRNKALTRK